MRRIHAEVEKHRARRSSVAAPHIEPPSAPVSSAAALPRSDLDAPAPVTLQLQESAGLRAQPEFQYQQGDRCHINDLLPYQDRSFVSAAYRVLLRRAPDDEGLRHCLENLRKGVSKIQILGDIRYSPEGRRAAVRIEGLAWPYGVQKACHLPLLGGLISIGVEFLQLPQLRRRQRLLENRLIELAEQANSRSELALRHIHAAMRELESACNRLVAHTALKSELEALQAIQAAKADRSAFDDERRILRLALDTKAGREELTTLTNYLVDLVQARLSKKDLESLEETVGTLAASMLAVERGKPDRAEIEAEQVRVQADVKASLEGFKRIGKDLETVRQQTLDSLKASLDPLTHETHGLKRSLLDQQRRVSALLKEARKRLPKSTSTEQIEVMVAEESHLLDSLYADLEDRFRGTRVDIRQRQSVYLPHIRSAKAGTARAPLIDVGCGRGEWLELLRDEGLTARGVDLNRVFLEVCRRMELDVDEQDAIEFLRNLKTGSVGAVTAFHLIEHLPHRTMIDLFDETLRVLRPGGIAIFETPNPENIVVGACTFYTDPTHLNPLPPEPTRFILEARGFSDVEIKRLHGDDSFKGDESMPPSIANLFAGARDYALIGRKSRR